MTDLKEWITFEDQLELLKRRGLHVDDDAAALGYLRRIGYYRLSGYWYPLREIDHAASTKAGRPLRLDTFVPGSRFEDVVRLYVFDKKLRLLALDALSVSSLRRVSTWPTCWGGMTHARMRIPPACMATFPDERSSRDVIAAEPCTRCGWKNISHCCTVRASFLSWSTIRRNTVAGCPYGLR